MGKDKDLLNKRLSALSATKVAAAPPPPAASRRKERAARQSAYRFARLVLPNGTQIKCIVRDISATGARVMIEGNFAIPQRAVLKIDQTGQTANVGIVWQKETEVGLAFER